MISRARIGALSGLLIAMAGGVPAAAQVHGHVAFVGGPIGVDVVFASDAVPAPRHRVVYRYDRRVPVRYRRGMSLYELERYLARIDREYDYYRRIHRRDAYRYLGWTEYQLGDYVDWLRAERRYLRDERRHLRRHQRAQQRAVRAWERDQRRYDRQWRRGRVRWGR